MTEIVEFSSAKAVLDFLRLSHDRWQFAQTVFDSHTWIFRGQGDSRWPLTPKSLRAVQPCLEDNQGNVPPYSDANPMPLPWRVLAQEYDRVVSFLRLADELGLLPAQDHEFGDFYSQLVEVASKKRDKLPEMAPKLMEACALAQHHGVPTRFLDWSASPLGALFFAARDAYDADDDRDSFAVWAVPRQRPGDERISVLTPARSRNPFARSQLGYLTYDKEVDRHYDLQSGWPSQDVVLAAYQGIWGDGKWPVLRKLIVPRSLAGEILSLLFQEGVSQAHLMPTLDNVVKTQEFLRKLSQQKMDRVLQLINNHGGRII